MSERGERAGRPGRAGLFGGLDELASALAALTPDPPMPPDPPDPNPDFDSDVAIDAEELTETPRRFKVILHNDDYTTMEFVVEVLKLFFHKDDLEAVHIMLTVHKKGQGVAGVYTRDVAETKVSAVTAHARESGMPLLVTAEPE